MIFFSPKIRCVQTFLELRYSSEYLAILVVLQSIKKQIKSTAQKMKFPIKYFCSKCDQIRSFQRIWSHLMKKSLMENFIFCTVVMLGNIRYFDISNR